MKILILISTVVLSFGVATGCSRLCYLEEALRLKAYSQEQEAIAADVALKDERFEHLLERIRSGNNLMLLKTGSALSQEFGDPVLKVTVMDHPGQVEWIYRHQVNRTDAPKVYFLVGEDDQIVSVHWQGVP